jgi:hypothetical protein
MTKGMCGPFQQLAPIPRGEVYVARAAKHLAESYALGFAGRANSFGRIFSLI